MPGRHPLLPHNLLDHLGPTRDLRVIRERKRRDLPGAMTLASETISRTSEEGSVPATVVVLSGFTEGAATLARPLPPAMGDLEGVRLVASEPSAGAEVWASVFDKQ